MRTCWTCRRRRVKCDGLLPHCNKCEAVGAECLGYGKLIRWTGSVASRGHMKDSTFKETERSSVSPAISNHTNTRLKYVNYVITPRDGLLGVQHHTNVTLHNMAAEGTPVLWMPRALTDPNLQDLSFKARGLVDYYDHSICSDVMMVDGLQNPYRDVISLVGASKAVANAMMAVAACHATHRRAGYPVFMNLDLASQSCDRLTIDEIKRTILFKQRALAYLKDDVSKPLHQTKICILATIVLLMLLELHEGGNGPWSVHLEGAKRLIDACAHDNDVHSTQMIQNIIEELTIFDVFGSTFSVHEPPTLPLSTRLRADCRDELSSLGGLGCPMQILTVIESVNLQWRTWANYEIPDASTPFEPPLQLINTALMNIIEFDVEKWADGVQTACPEKCSITREQILRLGTIWKLSAEIYTLHVVCQLTAHGHPTPQLYQLVAAISYFESTNRATRFLLWPTFIAGAESTLLEHRQWALTMLDKIWDITRIANSRTAAIVLMKIWEQHDSKVQYSSIQDPEVPSWMGYLSSLGSSWLFL